MKAYKLKIELIGSNPLIWRRVMLPANVTFFRLFDTIQNAMGRKGDSLRAHHLYEFILPDEKIRITNDTFGTGCKIGNCEGAGRETVETTRCESTNS